MCVPRFTSQMGMMAIIWPVQSEELLLSLPLGCRSPTIALGHPLLLPRRISWDLDWNWSNYGTGAIMVLANVWNRLVSQASVIPTVPQCLPL